MKLLVIKEIFAFVADSDGVGEGIMGVKIGDTWMALVGADMDRIESLIPIADTIKAKTGKDYKILKFSSREELTAKIKG